MSTNKSIRILKGFNEDQIKSFHSFLCSPYQNNRKILIELFDYIITYKPEFNEIMFEPNILKKSKIDSKLHDNRYLTKMMSFLYKELESFIVSEDIKNDPLQSDLRLLKYYNYNHFDDLYEDTIKDTLVQLDNKMKTSSINFFINENLCSFQSKHDTRKGDINYIPTIQSLNLFYYYNSLRIYCLMLNRALIVTQNYTDIIEKFPIHDETLKSLDNVSIKLYYMLFNLISKNKSKESFYEILHLLETNTNSILSEDVGIVYTILSNLSKQIFKDKKEEYYSVLFKIYKNQIEKKTIYINSKLQISYLKNAIILALHNNEFEWSLDFLEQNKNQIIPEEKDHVSYFYLLSEIYFAKKDYNLALENLAKTKSSDNLIKLAIKRLYLKIFLEIEEVDTFDSFTNSYKVFLSRIDSLTVEKKEAEKNFVNSMILLNRYKLEKNKKKLIALKSKIETENISEKNYLINTIQNYLL